MASETPPFSFEQDKGEPELPRPEAILALLQAEVQALKQVEIVSMQLYQALYQQITEVEILKTRMKQQRDIPGSIKKSSQEQNWWDILAVDIKGCQQQCEAYRTWLERAQETSSEKLSGFKRLQEEVDTLYPQ